MYDLHMRRLDDQTMPAPTLGDLEAGECFVYRETDFPEVRRVVLYGPLQIRGDKPGEVVYHTSLESGSMGWDLQSTEIRRVELIQPIEWRVVV